MKPIDARLYLLFTPRLCAGEPWATLAAALSGGVDLVQWRVEEPDSRGLRSCLETCERHGVPLIINNDVRAARRFDLAGAHIGQEDMPPRQARSLLGDEHWLGISTHDLVQVRAAETARADYLGFGPIYPSSTKGYQRGLGSEALAAALATTALPTFAIGGIDADHLPSLKDRGCERIAVSRCILSAKDPGLAARQLRAQL